MFNNTMKSRFVWSVVLLCGLLTVALISKEGDQPSPIHGESDYTITLNAANAPTTSSTYTDTLQTVRYTEFAYGDVKASEGNHVEMSANAWIRNNYQITSITGITVIFSGDGLLDISVSYDTTNYFEYPLTSGVRKDFANLPYYFQLMSCNAPVIIESIVLTYSCVGHPETLDKYEISWYDQDGITLLEKDVDVEPGSMPSYDGPTPSNPVDPEEGTFYTFAGWDWPLEPVTGNFSYFATYAPYMASYALINGGTEYELRSVSDNTLTSISIPSTYEGLPVTSIDQGVFDGFSSLTTVNFPDTLTNIDSEAFSNCGNLTSVTLPQNVSSIGVNAFVGCVSLTAIHVASGNVTFSSLDGVLFTYDQSQLLSFPEGKPVTTYAIPKGVTSLREFAFVGCSGLESVSFPSSLTTIGNAAFIACSYLDNVVLPDTVTTFGTGVFVNCFHLTTITLPSGMTSIPGSMFYHCESLANITLPSGVTTLENQAFDGCINLQTINLPTGLTSIGSSAFSHCVLLANVTLPEGLLTIRGNAFTDCDTFTQVNIPASVTSIGGYAFSDCSLLTAVNVHVDNANYASIDGVLLTEDLLTLILYPTGKTDASYTIPGSVTTIVSNAFRNNPFIESVIIPFTVTTIEYIGFYQCANATLNCVASEKPDGWNTTWNTGVPSVVWGYAA